MNSSMRTCGFELPSPILAAKCSNSSTSEGSNLTPAGKPGQSDATYVRTSQEAIALRRKQFKIKIRKKKKNSTLEEELASPLSISCLQLGHSLLASAPPSLLFIFLAIPLPVTSHALQTHELTVKDHNFSEKLHPFLNPILSIPCHRSAQLS